MTDIQDIITENSRRTSRLPADCDYITGDPSDPTRTPADIPWERGTVYLPASMVADPEFTRLSSHHQYARLGHRHDFAYWAATCVKIRHKLTGQNVDFKLNAPQRRVVAMLEADRVAGRPLRIIMLKARQWGGSTLVQMYFAWIQTIHRTNWNSLICAHVRDTAATIRGMYDTMLSAYPRQYWDDDEPPAFRAWQGARNTREISGRGCRVTIASSFGQDSSRGLDATMAHLSEVAFWKDTDKMSPDEFIRSVCGGVPMVPLSFIAMESTANGTGNFFHTEWLRASAGDSAYRPVFVAWHEIEIYRSPCPDPQALWNAMDKYERNLWDMGLTLEMIQWYHDKRREIGNDTAMHAEYPTTPDEAFANTGNGVFEPAHVEQMRKNCRTPLDIAEYDNSTAGRILLRTPGADGSLSIWALPDRAKPRWADRYIVTVDVGGRSLRSDPSVIAVFDRFPHGPGSLPEVVAQWRGHTYHDMLGHYAAKVAGAYHNALLVIESNSLESSAEGGSQYILEELNDTYPNLYVRTRRDGWREETTESRVGFHTNIRTKSLIVTALVAAVREGLYIERDTGACNEMLTYELRADGSYAAKRGHHDDLVMTRAMALYIHSTLGAPVPKITAGTFFRTPSW